MTLVAFRADASPREREVHAVDDAVEEQLALGRLELLRVLLGVGERTQVGLELVAHRRLDGVEASSPRG